MTSDGIKFKVYPHTVTYGDKRKFWEYRIAMYRDDVLVGLEESPRRANLTLAAMWKEAKARIAVLQSHRLFAVPITKDCIKRGEGHNCDTCAVSQALWENQERMGLDKREWNFRVESYGFMTDTRGIVLERRYGGEADKAIKEVVIATQGRDGKPYGDSLEIWTMQFDEWYDFRTMARVEWREKYGLEKGDTACQPAPASFVLDLDDLVAVA